MFLKFLYTPQSRSRSVHNLFLKNVDFSHLYNTSLELHFFSDFRILCRDRAQSPACSWFMVIRRRLDFYHLDLTTNGWAFYFYICLSADRFSVCTFLFLRPTCRAGSTNVGPALNFQAGPTKRLLTLAKPKLVPVCLAIYTRKNLYVHMKQIQFLFIFLCFLACRFKNINKFLFSVVHIYKTNNIKIMQSTKK